AGRRRPCRGGRRDERGVVLTKVVLAEQRVKGVRLCRNATRRLRGRREKLGGHGILTLQSEVDSGRHGGRQRHRRVVLRVLGRGGWWRRVLPRRGDRRLGKRVRLGGADGRRRDAGTAQQRVEGGGGLRSRRRGDLLRSGRRFELRRGRGGLRAGIRCRLLLGVGELRREPVDE